MSNLGGSDEPCGAWTDPREPHPEDQAILDKVKEEYKKRTGTNPQKFLAVLIRTQVVNGINYLFKVDTGEDTYSHLLVYVPLLCRHEEPYLVDFQLNKTKDDELEVFP